MARRQSNTFLFSLSLKEEEEEEDDDDEEDLVVPETVSFVRAPLPPPPRMMIDDELDVVDDDFIRRGLILCLARVFFAFRFCSNWSDGHKSRRSFSFVVCVVRPWLLLSLSLFFFFVCVFLCSFNLFFNF